MPAAMADPAIIATPLLISALPTFVVKSFLFSIACFFKCAGTLRPLKDALNSSSVISEK